MEIKKEKDSDVRNGSSGFQNVVEAPSSNNFILFGSGPIVLFVRIDTTENPRLPFYDSLTPFPCFGRMYE